ncbi:hypothetical protein [Halobaculum rubrum]|uniref:hypothetical protein n=1 Tax=Halobaculum rubrum TaxID=2872158 RepID=UPI001CA42E0D|nr:hypothetical protein [Halobaculum rubrum]QZX98731.1 hypothetical protein K6T25_10645 [Halobaculum rubrum]
MVVAEIVNGSKMLIAGGGGFVGGWYVWGAVSGVLAGLLDAVGISTPAAAWLVAGPLVGLLVAAFSANYVAGGGS